MPDLAHLCVQPDPFPESLFHYTNETGYRGILASGEIRPSLQSNQQKDARYGDGQYFTDLLPRRQAPEVLAQYLLLSPQHAYRFTHFIQITVAGLDLLQVKGREHVFFVPNQNMLEIDGRLVSSGLI